MSKIGVRQSTLGYHLNQYKNKQMQQRSTQRHTSNLKSSFCFFIIIRFYLSMENPPEQLFTLRNIKEQCSEWNAPLYTIFID